jgi:2-amino-4-hydroxy-6-hydroxymethyldihydropteridine diphosphokinase
MLPRVFLGLGSNAGNRVENLRLALRLLAPECRVVAVSSLYRSEAVVLEGSPPGPDYYNAACEIETRLSPADLLHHLKRIEHEIGRRPAARWAPRPIDLDILLYGDEIIDTPELVVPHPLMLARNFVMTPLLELAPDVVHPVAGTAIGELAEDTDFAGLEHIAWPAWASGRGQVTGDRGQVDEDDGDAAPSTEDSPS